MSQSRREQHEYLKNVELARVLDKRAERKRKAEEDGAVEEVTEKEKPGQTDTDRTHRRKKREKVDPLPALSNAGQLESVLGNLF